MELAAFDDAGFAEEMDRARDRGMAEAASIVDDTVNLVTGVVGVLATAAAVTVIQPLLLPCLLLAAVPEAVDRSADGPPASTWTCWPGSPGGAGCGCWPT